MRGQVVIKFAIMIAVMFILIVGVIPVFVSINTNLQMGRALDFLRDHGYVAYADNQGTLHVERIILSGSEPLTLIGDGLVWFELRPDIDFESVRANGKPSWVKRGIIGGWSLPPNVVNEELYMELHVPDRWDEASDVLVHVHYYLDTANTDKNVNLELSWVHFTDGDIMPNTSTDLTVETATGAADQYKGFHVEFTLDYDIHPADLIVHSDELHFKLRRLDATSNEAAGEIVITHVGILFRRDKLGAETP